MADAPPPPDPRPQDPASAPAEVSAATVAHTARLARLSLEPEEARTLGAQLARLLATFGTLAELEAGPGSEPTNGERDPEALADAHPGTRPDEPRPPLAREDLLRPAPEAIDGFFGVPKTIGGEA